MQVTSNTAIVSRHLPVLIPLMIDTVRSVMTKQEDVLWYNEASWVTINVAIRAVVGELLTMEAAEKIFPLFETMASGCLALVRSTCLRYDLHGCAQPVSRLFSIGALDLSSV
jgi:hypothetical protein